MRILAVETSSNVAAAAIIDEDRLLGEYIINHKKTHSQKLMPIVEGLLKSLELDIADIDLFAASSGPGSFTGLRIGVTTVKAMAYAAGKGVVSVPTLDSLAYNIAIGENLVCPMMDARNNQVYTALYHWKGGRQIRTSDYMGIHIAELIKAVKEKKQKVVFLGDGAVVHKEALKMELEDNCLIPDGNLMLPKASSVAFVARRIANDGNIGSCFDMVPYYLRKSQAEQEYDRKMGAGCGE